jgi:hypothetical protein
MNEMKLDVRILSKIVRNLLGFKYHSRPEKGSNN